MATAQTIINKFGKMQGWNSITLNMLGRDVEGITALSYDDSVAKDNVYGANKYPVGRSEGNYEPKASITLLKEEVDAIQAALPGGKRLQDIEAFDIVVSYQRNDGTVLRDRIRNAEFTNNAVDVKQADGTVAKELTLIVSHIEWDVA